MRTRAAPAPAPTPQSGGYPFTLAQYNALVAAYASGVLRVQIEGREVIYRSADDMMRALARMQAELQAAGLLPPPDPPLPTRVRYVTVKGLW